MIKSSAAFTALGLALSASALSAQTMDGRTSESPPEVDVLASAVNAISRMHMESFSDSTLWEAAIDGIEAAEARIGHGAGVRVDGGTRAEVALDAVPA